MMFDKKKTGPQDSLSVLFSDKFAGKMTYLDEMRDTVGLSALRPRSYDPASLTQEQFDASLAQIEKAVKSGLGPPGPGQLVHRGLMIGGGAVLAMGWSGDITLIQPGQTKSQDFQWVLATEGGMLWTDNMAIPKGTPNKLLAEHLDRLLLRPEERGGHRGLRQLRLPGQRRPRGDADHSTPRWPTTRSSSRRRTGWRASISSATRRRRRRSPGPRRSPRPRASRRSDAPRDQLPDRSPRTPCWRRACSG